MTSGLASVYKPAALQPSDRLRGKILAGPGSNFLARVLILAGAGADPGFLVKIRSRLAEVMKFFEN